MYIVGHRGAAGLVAENTISSFKKAEELGVDAIELDLRKTKDDCIIVMHDPDLRRTHNLPKKISELTFEELQKATNSNIPQLSEVLSVLKVPVNLEVKEIGFEKQLLETIKGFPFEIVISSFNPFVLKKIRILDRNIKLGLIISSKTKYLFYLSVLYSYHLGLDSVNPHHSLLTSKRMKLLSRYGFRVFTWVVNDLGEFERVKELGVDGVVTDLPDLIKK